MEHREQGWNSFADHLTGGCVLRVSTLVSQMGSPVVHEPPPLGQVHAPVGGLDLVADHMCKRRPCHFAGSAVSSAAQYQNDDRKPWGTTATPSLLSSLDNAVLESGFPRIGNTSGPRPTARTLLRLGGYPPEFAGGETSHRGRRSMTLMITSLQWPRATGTPVVNTTPSPA